MSGIEPPLFNDSSFWSNAPESRYWLLTLSQEDAISLKLSSLQLETLCPFGGPLMIAGGSYNSEKKSLLLLGEQEAKPACEGWLQCFCATATMPDQRNGGGFVLAILKRKA
jgi:hypothetical protein